MMKREPSNHQADWKEWIRLAQTGDSGAMIALLERFEPLVHGAVAARHPKREERDDLLQEAYVALIRAIQLYNHGEVSFPHFAKQVVYGATHSAVRRQKRIRERETPDGVRNEDGEMLSLFDRLPDEQAAAAYLEPELESYLLSLSPRERMVIVEVVFGGMRMSDLARREGVSLDTVKVWKKRAFAKIRQMVREQMDV
jgi:RNA polymerase sigma factor (sigma-70 family)